MHLSSLKVRGFRNLADQRLDFPAEGVALIADNGQGKTNLLEAIYYLEIFRSFRGVPDEQLVTFSDEVFRIEGEAQVSGRLRRVTAAFDRRARRKKVTVDDVEPDRLGDALGKIGVVIFSPADVTIVAGSPSERRRFLDIVLSLTEAGYLYALQKYRQVLLRRNALLRRGASQMDIGAWDGGLVSWGSRVIAARARWTRSRAEAFGRHVRAIAGEGDGQMEYVSPSSADDSEAILEEARIAETFALELERAREREVRRGMTLVGPHRDDLRIRGFDPASGAWTDLRNYGSGGQQRTAAIALRMVEAETLREHSGEKPIVLLDDVFAELDAGRSRRILEWIDGEEGGQVILTAPKPTDLELRGGILRRWTIRNGVVGAL